MTQSNRNNIWNKILATKYENNPPSLNDKNFLKSARVLLNTILSDFSVVTTPLDTKVRTKLQHLHGSCFKFTYEPNQSFGDDDFKDSILGTTQYGICRLSIQEPFVPTIAFKFYLGDNTTEDLLLVPHNLEQDSPKPFTGIESTFDNIIYRTWFDFPVHRHVQASLLIFIVLPVFKEVSRLFSIRFKHLFAPAEAPNILTVMPNTGMTIETIKNKEQIFTIHGDNKLVGTIYAESEAIQSEYGDKNLHFKHNLVAPLKSYYPWSLLPRWIEMIYIVITRVLRGDSAITTAYLIYPALAFLVWKYIQKRAMSITTMT